MKTACNYSEKNDGIVWMAFEDFIIYFSQVSYCEILDSWDKVILEGNLRPGPNDGGTPNNITKHVGSFPQFLIRFGEKVPENKSGSGKIHLKIIIEQLGDMSIIGIAITMRNGKKIDYLIQNTQYRQYEMFSRGPLDSIEWELDYLPEPWTLVPYRKYPSSKPVHWVFTIFSDYQMEVTPCD